MYKLTQRQQTKPVHSVRLPEGDMVCNDPSFIREALQSGYKVRKLQWIRQPWETGEVVTMENFNFERV